MAYVQVARAAEPSFLGRAADASLIFLLLGVPFAIIAAAMPLVLAIAGVVWVARQLFG